MLSKRWLINYALFVLVIVFTYIGNKYDVQTGYQPDRNISSLKPADITRISIQTADSTLSMERPNASWQLTSPIGWPANNINVERILDIVNHQTDSRLAASEIDLATIGLQFPRAVMRLNDTQVLFGATNNIGERRYTMIDSTVFLLPDVQLPFISQGLVGLVDRRLIPRSFNLQRLSLPGFDIKRRGDSDWILSPANEKYSPDAMNQLVENWRGLEASRVKTYNSRETPRQKVTAVLEGAKSLEFFVMSIEPEIIIANPAIGLQYHFPSERYYQLIALPANETSG